MKVSILLTLIFFNSAVFANSNIQSIRGYEVELEYFDIENKTEFHGVLEWIKDKIEQFDAFNSEVGIGNPLADNYEGQSNIRRVLNIEGGIGDYGGGYSEINESSVRIKNVRLSYEGLLKDMENNNPFVLFHGLAHGIFMYNHVDDFFSEPLADLYAISVMKSFNYQNIYLPNHGDLDLESVPKGVLYICSTPDKHRDFSSVTSLASFFDLAKYKRYDAFDSYDYSCVLNSQVYNLYQQTGGNLPPKRLIKWLYDKKVRGELKSLGLDFMHEITAMILPENGLERFGHIDNHNIQLVLEADEFGKMTPLVQIDGLNRQDYILELKSNGSSRVIRSWPDRGQLVQDFTHRIETSFSSESEIREWEIKFCPNIPVMAKVYFKSGELNPVVASKWFSVQIENFNTCLSESVWLEQ